MGQETIQELPFDPTRPLDNDQISVLREYCRNDLSVTAELYRPLAGQLALRQHPSNNYDLDLRSHSDAAIAETVLCAEYERRTGIAKNGQPL